VTWSDSDPDDDAQVSLWWDADTDSGNNLPGDEGVGWGVIATGLSEDDPADSFDWTVDAPWEGEYYLRAVITDGIATDEGYTATTFYVIPPGVERASVASDIHHPLALMGDTWRLAQTLPTWCPTIATVRRTFSCATAGRAWSSV